MDVGVVRERLKELRRFYPDFDEWLTRKVKAPGVTVDSTPERTVIFTEKQGSLKVNTFLVNEGNRRRGVGSSTLQKVLGASQAGTVYVTADSTLRDTVGRFFEKHGFTRTYSDVDKYRTGATEDTYELKRDRLTEKKEEQ